MVLRGLANRRRASPLVAGDDSGVDTRCGGSASSNCLLAAGHPHGLHLREPRLRGRASSPSDTLSSNLEWSRRSRTPGVCAEHRPASAVGFTSNFPRPLLGRLAHEPMSCGKMPAPRFAALVLRDTSSAWNGSWTQFVPCFIPRGCQTGQLARSLYVIPPAQEWCPGRIRTCPPASRGR
jgi:hypothetical protein